MKLKHIALASVATLAAIAAVAGASPQGTVAKATPASTAAVSTTATTTERTTTATTTTEAVTTEAVAETAPSVAAPVKTSTITVKGTDIAYKNTSQDELQAFINANQDMAGTYYGSAFSGTDGAPTHFAGHDYGKFGVIQQLVAGDEVTVTDENGTSYTYVVTETYMATAVYSNGEAYLTSQADVDFITRQMNATTEMIYLQTCASEVVNGSFNVFYAVAVPK